ncbi:hypothetical protein CKN86_11965 [Carnobacterium divergens]|uniref:hypothetical protein n=1 Tax=Carnobacterium divergens TaxID=2748 RepID=UPI000D21CDD7|nr:hypothetical protein [Carnobacterium divergens]MCO6017445.1 hypothetical protein [Carnobacterium divergens]TFI61120.1 hypothetical protein CKN62_12105 [Carnobacterium divergens]TFI88142.1 hypothetical protein CKN84_11995 [Carnobacterium divergens]TFJ02710.1 hypothetical protein CKN86_11965 [Carnobacterium divergens]TFJ04220.1 hypothetical protein CKN65_12005 [Carnobacterium divergens]
MKNKKITIISLIGILLVGGSTFYAFNKAQETNREKTELAQNKIDKANKKKQNKILAEKKKLEVEKKKLEDEQKAKQGELDLLKAENKSTESIQEESDSKENSANESEISTVNDNTVDNTDVGKETINDIPQRKGPIVSDSTTVDDSQSVIKEIENYYNLKRTETINKKRNQVMQWKINGEVNWSDELINSSLQDFENSLPTITSYRAETLEYAKVLIDKAFDDSYNYMLNK